MSVDSSREDLPANVFPGYFTFKTAGDHNPDVEISIHCGTGEDCEGVSINLDSAPGSMGIYLPTAAAFRELIATMEDHLAEWEMTCAHHDDAEQRAETYFQRCKEIDANVSDHGERSRLKTKLREELAL